MLILNPRRVAEHLRADTLSEVTKARLVLIGFLITLVFGGGSLAGYRTWGDLLLSAIGIGIAIGGFWSCFRVNQAGDGRAFIERYMCLSVPLTLWLYGAYIIGYYVAFWLLRSRPGFGASDYAATVRPYFLLASLGILGLFFVLLRRQFRFVAHSSLSNVR